MEVAIIIALLASNVWLIRKVLTKPDAPVATNPAATDTGQEKENTEAQPDTAGDESVVGRSTFDINDFRDVFREAAREAAKEVIPLIIKEYGKPSDAGMPDEPEDKRPAQVPDEKLDDLFNEKTAGEINGDDPTLAEPTADGVGFPEIDKTVRVLKDMPHTPEDVETARRVLPDIQNTQIIERIKLDPLVRKRILMIECQLPEIPADTDNPPQKPEEAKPKKKIVFHADIDTTDIDAIDFNILH